jgi:hypothetical protein
VKPSATRRVTITQTNVQITGYVRVSRSYTEANGHIHNRRPLYQSSYSFCILPNCWCMLHTTYFAQVGVQRVATEPLSSIEADGSPGRLPRVCYLCSHLFMCALDSFHLHLADNNTPIVVESELACGYQDTEGNSPCNLLVFAGYNWFSTTITQSVRRTKITGPPHYG